MDKVPDELKRQLGSYKGKEIEALPNLISIVSTTTTKYKLKNI